STEGRSAPRRGDSRRFAMFALYFYRSLDPAGGDYTDLSCRPDPDFDWLTLGICRPQLRERISREALAASATIAFYTVEPGIHELLFTALLTIGAEGVSESHRVASSQYSTVHPASLLVPGTVCRCGTRFSTRSKMKLRDGCSCRDYVGRESTPYLIFDKKS